MHRTTLVLAVLLTLLVVSTTAFAYTSDRMDFGEIDFGGATVTFVLHHDHLADFREGGLPAGRLEEAKKLFNIGDIQIVQADWGAVGEVALNRYLSGDSTYDVWRLPHYAFFMLAPRRFLPSRHHFAAGVL